MMKYFPYFLYLLPWFIQAQNQDSLAVAQVIDSLIQTNRTLVEQEKFEEALHILETATNLTANTFGKEHLIYSSCLSYYGTTHYKMGHYRDAEDYFLQAKSIQERIDSINHPIYALTLNNLGCVYTDLEKFDQAEILFHEAKIIRERVLGKETSEYAETLNDLAGLYVYMHKYSQAESLFQETKAIRERVLGKNHIDYATTLLNLGILYMYSGKYENAEVTLLESKQLLESIVGKNHLHYAHCIHELGVLYTKMTNYEKSEQLLNETILLKKNLFGEENISYARSLTSLGILFKKESKFELAERLYLQAKSITAKLLGEDNLTYAWDLNNLGNLYMEMGNYELAEVQHLEAKNIREKIVGKNNPNYIASLLNLGNLYGSMGNTEKSEIVWLEAKNLSQDKGQSLYPMILMDLSVLYRQMGDFKRSENLIVEAIPMLVRIFGEKDIYAQCLVNLALLYRQIGNTTQVEPLLLQAKSIYEKLVGREHPGFGQSLYGLGMYYSDIKDFKKAEQCLLELKEIRANTIGKSHPDYALCLDALGMLYSEAGYYEKAELNYIEANDIIQKTIGKENLKYAFCLYNTAVLYNGTGNIKKTDSIFSELSQLTKRLIIKSASHLSETQLGTYIEMNDACKDQFFSHNTLDPALFAKIGYENALFFKGFLQENAYSLEKAISSAPDSLRNSYARWKGYHRRLAAEYSKPITERQNVPGLEARADSLEKILVRSVAGFDNTRREVTYRDVQAKLHSGEVAIEFVHYQYYNHKGKATDSTLYAALVLQPSQEVPKWISLFEQKQLDSLLLGAEGHKPEYINGLYSQGSESALYDLIWKPLESLLSGVKTVYFSPSGTLHRINFDAIATAPNTMLSDRYQLVRLGSTRQLVVPSGTAIANNDAALFGGIRYEVDSAAFAPLPSSLPPTGNLLGLRGSLTFNALFDSTLRRGEWGYLEFTEREVSEIEPILAKNKLKPLVRRNFAASEETFKRLGQGGASPRVLHVATHGFFFPDPKNSRGGPSTSIDREPIFKLSDNPMMRAGLLLAGANRVWKGEPQIENLDDGILTAYEVSQMNLWNTELVVLSACETGLGDVHGSEGVYGLQRAFKIAGAQYVIMSLWQVPDKQTSQLMKAFYHNWLEKGMAIPEAFRAAQKEMRNEGLEPFKWAGFVLLE